MPDSEELPGDYRIIGVDEAETRYEVSRDVEHPYRDFADQTEIRLYQGDVHVPGDVHLSEWLGQEHQCHNVIVDGDLTLDGDLTISNGEGTGFFVLVTGTLRARNVLLRGFPNLAVRGDLTATNGIEGSYGDDGGYLAVTGATSAPIIVNTLYFRMFLAGPVDAVLVSDPYRINHPVDYADDDLADVAQPEMLDDGGDVDADRIEQALRDGRPILRPTAVPKHLAALAELDALLADADEVTTLDLSERNLRAVPEQVFGFPNLRVLSLADNDEIGELPERIGELAGLEELDVFGTGLTELPAAIGRLTRLRVLDISNLRLSALPEEIGDLKSLTVLQARRLACPIPDALGRLSALEELRLELVDGHRRIDFPIAVTRLPRLRVLDLSGSTLASIPEELLSVTTLEELDLNLALGHVERLPDLSKLPRLRALRVCGGRANGPYPHIGLLDTVWGVTTLEELDIDRWGEKSAYNPDTKAHDVIRPAVTALPGDAFARMPGLRRLDVSFNALTTLPESFYRLAHLEFVDLRYTRLDATTLDRLREHYPRVRMDLRNVKTRAESDDPGWQAVHALVAEGARTMSSPADAIPLFEQAIAQCATGARYSEYDQLYALYGAVDALSRVIKANGETDGDRVDALIGYAEQALELVPDPAAVWHFTDEGAFQEEVTRKTGNALAWCLLERGEHDRALATVDRALAVADGSDHDYIRDTKVRILLAMGRTHDAYVIVDTVLTREPNFSDFADLRQATDFQRWRQVNSV